MTDPDPEPEHLRAAAEGTFPVDRFHHLLESAVDEHKARSLLESPRCPQPYGPGEDTVQAWEGEYTVANAKVDSETAGWEIREKGTDHGDGVWLRSSVRYKPLDDVA